MIVNKKTYADMRGVSAKTVGNWIDQGMPTEGGGGRGKEVQLDTVRCFEWELNRARGEADEDSKESAKDYEMRRLYKARADDKELDVSERQRRLIPRTEAMQLCMAIMNVVVSGLDAIANRQCGTLAAETESDAIRHLLLTETRSIRANAAQRLRDSFSRWRRSAGGDAGGETADDA